VGMLLLRAASKRSVAVLMARLMGDALCDHLGCRLRRLE
jgi:hypothetical protein